MVLSLIGLLLISAFILTIVHAGWGKVPLWVPVLLVIFAALMKVIPIG